MKFLNGCDALARGAWEAGVGFVGSYPGSPVTGIVEQLLKFPEIRTRWMANEKVALETAIGAAHAGQRALVVMKHVGLNVAADPFFNVAYTGVRGGLVIVVGDDPGAKASQNEQDTRKLAEAANVPVLEPASVEEALLFPRLAFEISEQFDLPVVLRITTPLCYSTARVVTGTREQPSLKLGFAKPIEKFLLLPAFVPARHRDLNRRLGRLAGSHWSRWFADPLLPVPPAERYPYGIVVSGFPFSQVWERFKGKVPILKLGMPFPLNEAAVLEFAARCERVLVVEESSRLVEDRLRALGVNVARRPHFDGVGEFSLKHLESPDIPEIAEILKAPLLRPTAARYRHRLTPISVTSAPAPDDTALAAPPRPPGFCAGCSHRGIFYTLAQRNLYVVGDIGCYTLGSLEPHRALHANLCMGASLGILQGYLSAMGPEAAKSCIAVIGDSTFFHSGIPPLLTAVTAGTPGTVLILDNAGTAMTGFQLTIRPFRKEDWERLLGALRVPEFAVVDALDLQQIETTLDRFLASDRLSVMVLKGNCVQSLPHKGPTNYRYTIREDLCTACGDCLKVDCPAIVPTWEKGKTRLLSVAISTECIGCGLCSQSCSAHAILPRTVSFKWSGLTRLLAPVPWHRVIRTLRSIGPIRHLLEKFERETF
jgi:indolepyruvate ferredoxin oxidoreductase alpha subunit